MYILCFPFMISNIPYLLYSPHGALKIVKIASKNARQIVYLTSVHFIMLTSPCNEYPPYTQLLYSKSGVYMGIHYFLIFALKHRLCSEQTYEKYRKFSSKSYHFLSLFEIAA